MASKRRAVWAERGLFSLGPAIGRLRLTNFRIDPALLDRLLAAGERRHRFKLASRKPE